MMFVKSRDGQLINLAHVVTIDYEEDGTLVLYTSTFDRYKVEAKYRERLETALRRINEAVIFSAK